MVNYMLYNETPCKIINKITGRAPTLLKTHLATSTFDICHNPQHAQLKTTSRPPRRESTFSSPWISQYESNINLRGPGFCFFQMDAGQPTSEKADRDKQAPQQAPHRKL